MKLEPKHIVPYLPYGLNFQCIDIESGEYEELPLTALILTDGKQDLIIGNQECDIDDLFANEYEAFYPILRPLSDLTKEIEVNGEKFVPYKKLGWGNGTHVIPAILGGYTNYNESSKLFEWHFDVFGFIPRNLAIDINTLQP